MSAFIAQFAPIFVIWTIPLAPMIYAGIAATIENLRESVQNRTSRSVSTNVKSAVRGQAAGEAA